MGFTRNVHHWTDIDPHIVIQKILNIIKFRRTTGNSFKSHSHKPQHLRIIVPNFEFNDYGRVKVRKNPFKIILANWLNFKICNISKPAHLRLRRSEMWALRHHFGAVPLGYNKIPYCHQLADTFGKFHGQRLHYKIWKWNISETVRLRQKRSEIWTLRVKLLWYFQT